MDYELIDIHSHVNFNAFKDDGDEVLKRTLHENTGTILVGSQIDTSRRAIEYAEKYKNGIWAAIGLHPIHLIEMTVDPEEIQGGTLGFVSRVEKFDYEQYKKLALNRKVVAIGECGLDYFHLNRGVKERLGAVDEGKLKKNQEEAFRLQVTLAREVKKPLMIHCRDAYNDIITILQSERARDIGGNIHFFVGDWKIARQFLDLGFFLSFTGVITFAHQYDEVIKKAPLDRIMVETDAPYVAPAPYRGKRNEPLYVKEVVRRIAEIRGISFSDTAQITVDNAVRLFHLQ